MTPLAAIRGYVETLTMPELRIDEPTRARYLEIVEEETHKLEAIIGDLLDLARLEGGGDTLDSEEVLVDDLLRRVADRHQPVLLEPRHYAQHDRRPRTRRSSGEMRIVSNRRCRTSRRMRSVTRRTAER